MLSRHLSTNFRIRTYWQNVHCFQTRPRTFLSQYESGLPPEAADLRRIARRMSGGWKEGFARQGRDGSAGGSQHRSDEK